MKWAARLFRRSVRQALPVTRPKLRVESLEHREVPASIAGNVFRDFNNNGTSNAPDAPIAGVTVRVTGGALTAPVTATTDASGNFTLANLAAGTYTVTAVAPTGTAAGKTTAGTAAGTAGATNTVTGVTLTADQAATGYTFGQVPNALSSRGKVFFDADGDGIQDANEKGIAGVTVTLTGTSALTGAAITPKVLLTNATGEFLFTGLASGTYAIAETPKAGFVRGTLTNGTPAAASTTGGTFTGIDLTASATASTGYTFADVKAPVLELTQTVNRPRATAGQQVTITYTAKNPGVQPISNAAASVNLDGLTFVSSNATGYDNATKTWTIGTLAAGASATMTVTATVPSNAVFLPASRLVSTDTPSITGDTAFSRINGGTGGGVSMQNFLTSTFRTQAVGIGGTPTFPAAPTGGTTTPTAPTVNFFNAAGTTALTGASTTEATVTIKGTTSANAAVTIVETGATATADAAGAYTFSADPVVVGSNTFTVKAGTGTATSQTAGTVTRTSTTAPTTPTLQLFNAAGTTQLTNGSTTEATATFKGTTSANTAVTITETGATATSDSAGAFTFSAVPLTVGSNTFTVKAGTGTNTSQAVAIISRTTTPTTTPAAPTVTFFNAAGTAALTGGSTTEATTVITGTTSPNAAVTITQTGATATADSAGTYTFNAVPLTAGANTFTVRAGTGTATSQTTASLTRTTTPATPTTPVVFFFDDNNNQITGSTALGTVSIKGSTSPNTPLVLVGTDETTTSDSGGSYEFADVPVIVGANTYTVRAGTGTATSQATGTLTGTATTDTPTAPTVTFFNAAGDTAVPAGGTNEGTVTIKGTTSPSATLTLVQTGDTAIADDAGAYEFPEVPVIVGANSFTVQATGDDGTTRQTTASVTGTATTATPTAPTVNFFNAAGDTAVTGGSTNEATATIKGTTSPDATVTLVETDDTAVADETGAYQFDGVPVEVGANTFTVRATGDDGTARRTVGTLTGTAPAAPTVPLSPTVTFFNAAGTTQLTAGSTSEATTVIKGTTSPNATVTLVETGATATASAAGAYTFNAVPVAAGANTFTVRAGTGTNTNQTAATLAGVAQVAVYAFYNAAGTTVLPNGNTSEATTVIKGTTTANATVTLVETGATATANSAGEFTFNAVALTLGANTFTVRTGTGAAATDAVATVTRTGATPTTPTVNFFDPAGTTAVTGGTTTAATATIKGTTNANTPVTLVETGATATSDSAGAYTFSAVPLVVGSNTFTVRAGTAPNTSQATGTVTRTSTGTPPTTPTVTFFNAAGTTAVTGGTTAETTAVIKGTTSANTAVTLVETGATATSDSAGAYTFSAVPLGLGANTFTVRAGTGTNTSQAAGTITRTAGANAAPTISNQQAAVALSSATQSQMIDLAGKFTDADLGSTKVKFTTSLGDVNIDLFDKQAPQTVANFLNYITGDDFDNSIFHRSVSNFVLQGGGFAFESDGTPSITEVADDPAVQNEPDAVNRSNLRGTIAMAKLGGNPNSATNQFFFNLGNNSANLDAQNGGFTVFAKVSAAADQAVVDALAAIPTQDKSTAPGLPASQQGVFDDIPLRNYTGTNFPTDTTLANYAAITDAVIVSQPEALTYSVVSNTNTTAVVTQIVNNRLTVTRVAGQTGSATITVRATDKAGATVDMTFTVTVS